MASENRPGAEGTEKQQKKGEAQQGAEKRAGQPSGAMAERKGAGATEERRGGGGLTRRERHLPMLRSGDVWAMSPFSLMRRMMSDFDRMSEEMGFGGLTRGGEELPGEALARGGPWSPQVDVFEREGNLVVRADLPGLKKEDLRVEMSEDALVIEGERRREQTEEGAGFYRAERSYGSFRRAIPLPEGVSAEQVDARFENGVLEISMPLPKERAHGKRIEIREGGETKSVH
ncbi:Hsp20/alpha crystallin family protein [Anaeromyxobacter sp. Fw109-5]|uniref:Hsp20/alpha crystallin family protein n=1 Tax=Anaeromyxobacter sp. (strain Fw109-5) TaxID=404589 RepID=UPI0000ED8AB1|nr:Hsp20/alpha crystallin family protein [Anaeromyxobacter sp. Fw109-5]ABS27276.1 heat shock protein Hsp20 [Anaeromyxobacter sp. Fw109-5]